MTKAQLMKMGIVLARIHHNPHRHYCSSIHVHITIPKDATPEDVVELIFEEGLKKGIEQGKSIRSQEFCRLLNVKSLSYRLIEEED